MLDKQSYMRVGACTRTHKHTHTYVIFIAFPLQLISESASVLRYTYIVCLVKNTGLFSSTQEGRSWLQELVTAILYRIFRFVDREHHNLRWPVRTSKSGTVTSSTTNFLQRRFYNMCFRKWCLFYVKNYNRCWGKFELSCGLRYRTCRRISEGYW
jgi:hypothetical protein